MRQVFMLGICCLLGFVTGCGEEEGQVEAGKVRVTVVNVVEGENLVEAKLKVEFVGRKKVKLYTANDSMSLSAQAVNSSGVIESEILLVADWVDGRESGRMKWSAKVSSGNASSRRPCCYTVDEGESLEGMLAIGIEDGDYEMGTDIEVCVFRDETYLLRVE